MKCSAAVSWNIALWIHFWSVMLWPRKAVHLEPLLSDSKCSTRDPYCHPSESLNRTPSYMSINHCVFHLDGLSFIRYTYILLQIKIDSWQLGCTPLIPALRRQKQVDLSEFEANTVYRVSFTGQAPTLQRKMSWKTKQNKTFNSVGDFCFTLLLFWWFCLFNFVFVFCFAFWLFLLSSLLLSFSGTVGCSLILSFASCLISTCEWVHTVFVFLSLGYLPQDDFY